MTFRHVMFAETRPGWCVRLAAFAVVLFVIIVAVQLLALA